MRRAIGKHLRDFIAILVLIVLAGGVGAFILSNQRLYLPGWVPFVGQDFYTLKADFSTAQAVTPGQGQTVNIAGVRVGEISDVSLKNGVAVVEMKIRPKYAKVYPNATMLLRPKTGLKDMTVEMDPGSPAAGPRLKSGAVVPISNTQPDVNLDEILAVLDADTRDYLRLLLNGGGAGLQGNGRALAQTLRRFDPTTRDLAKITSQLQTRAKNVRSVTHNFQLLANELGSKDTQLAGFVDSSNAVFRDFAAQDQNIRQTLALLPGALGATNTALVKANRLASVLGPTLGALRPAARALGPSLEQSTAFFKATTPVLQNQLRPNSRTLLPIVQILRPAAANLADATPNLTTTAKVLNYALNELAYNPPGAAEGFLFALSFANHNADGLFGNQDGNGAVRRGSFEGSCSSLGQIFQLADGLTRKGFSSTRTLVDFLRAPVCAGQEPAVPGGTP